MASISSTSSTGRTNSIYGNRNVLTGIASGLDTEGMIENAISAYKTKINSFQQQRTKTEWKQESYRSMIAKMAGFSDKYTSYQSSNNLMSTSFFNQAVQTIARGENASKISATGRTSSNISIDAVRQLATASRYTVSGSAIQQMGGGENAAALAGALNLDDMSVSSFSGTMNLKYGSSTLSLSFKESQVFKDAQEMADEINKQLADQTISFTGGGSAKASERVEAKVVNGNISFVEKGSAKNGVYISGASKSIQDALGFKPGQGVTMFNASSDKLSKEIDNVADYFAESPLTMTLDGVSKTVKMPGTEDILAQLGDNSALADKIRKGEELSIEDRNARDEAYVKALQKNIDNAFGEGKIKVSDNMEDNYDNHGLQLKFEAQKDGSSFQIKSDKGDFMGFGDNGLTSYLDTGKSLKDLGVLDGMEAIKKVKLDEDGNEVRDENGNLVYEKDKDGNDVYLTDKDGKKLYSFKINGVEIGQFNEDTTIGTLMNKINGNKEANVNVSYSKLTNEFTFTAKETGVAGKVEFGDGLAAKLFGPQGEATEQEDGSVKYENGATFSAGKDAIFTATINGKQIEMTRSSNAVDFDGMTVTLKGEFGLSQDKDGNYLDKDGNITTDKMQAALDPKSESVTFETSADADKIVDAIKAMVNDYNTMVTEIKNAYSTLPEKRSNGAYYQPLTDDDKADMSESAIASWEEKAKTGILFGDNDLRSLYSRLTKAISMTGQNGADLAAAGITTNYTNGLTTLALNETKLRETLSTDPDRVMEIFTKSKENGAESDGIMAAIKEPLDLYGKVSGVNLSTGTKGVLVNKAGSPLAPSTMYTNTIQKELDRIDEQISKWQDKMSDQVDYYITQFSRLEQLIAQMNSQSSAIAGMMGQ